MKKILFGFLAMIAMMSVVSCSSTDELADANWETFTAPNATVAFYTGGEAKLDDVGVSGDSEGTRLIGAARGVITNVADYTAFQIKSKDGYLVGFAPLDGSPLVIEDVTYGDDDTLMVIALDDLLAEDPSIDIDREVAIVNFYNADDTEKTTPIGTFKLVL